MAVKGKEAGSAKDAGSSAKNNPPAPAPKETPKAVQAATGPSGLEKLAPYLGAGFVVSLGLVFVGERLLGTMDGFRMALSGLGVVGAIGTTALRFMLLAGQKDPERQRIERTLGLFSIVGLVSIGLYFLANTDVGRGLAGIADAAPDKRARFDGATTVAWIVLGAISVAPIIFGEAALAPMRRAPRVEVRRVYAAAGAGLTLALAAAYSSLFTYASGELDVKVDYSYFRTAKASESTKNIIKSTSEPVEVRAFFPPLNDVGVEIDAYLADIAKTAPNFKYGFYDRLLYPQLAKDNKVTQDAVLVILKGPSRETLTLDKEMNKAAAKLKTLDADFQKALLKAMKDPRTAYLTVGHGEVNEGSSTAEGRSGKLLRRILEGQNYSIKDLGLPQGLATDVPEDASVVIVFGPTQAFSQAEVDSLDRFAKRGGKLLIALDPDAKGDMGPLANIAGLAFDPMIVATTDQFFVPRTRNASDKANLITNRFSSHASISTLSRVSSRAVVLLPMTGSLEKKQTEAKVDFVLRSSSGTFGDKNGNYELDPDEKKATFNLAAAVSQPLAEGVNKDKVKGPAETRMFVIADADCLSDLAIGFAETNQVFFVDAVRWLSGDESFSGEIATPEDVRIQHTKQKDVFWFYGTIIGAPALLLGAGILTTRRTRRTARRQA